MGYDITKELKNFVASLSHLQDSPVHLLGHFVKLRIIKLYQFFPLIIVGMALIEG